MVHAGVSLHIAAINQHPEAALFVQPKSEGSDETVPEANNVEEHLYGVRLQHVSVARCTPSDEN